MGNQTVPGSISDVNVQIKALTLDPNVSSQYKTKILPKNVVDGVNTLVQSMMPLDAGQNTKYVIRYDYDLNKQTITVPENCILEFDGGSLDNGVLIGNKTAIEAPSGKIFGDNLALFKYGFFHYPGSVGYVTDWEIPLEYGDTLDTVVINPSELASITGNTYTEKVVTDGFERMSNANDNGIIQSIGTILTIDTDLVIEPKVKITFDANGRSRNSFVGLLNNCTFITVYAENGQFTVPSKSHAIFYNSSRKLNVGETVSADDVYVAPLSRLVALVDKSTFIGKAKLSWFIGNDFVTDEKDVPNAPDVTKNVQKAFLCSLDIESDIEGFIRVEDSIYAETPKVFDFGNRYDLIGLQGQYGGSAAKLNANKPIPATCFITLNMNKPLLYIRNSDIKMYGGSFMAKYATTHTSDVCEIDCDYYINDVIIDGTGFFGKTENGSSIVTTEKGINFLINDRNIGYFTGSKISAMIQDTKYGLYKEAVTNPEIFVNTIDLYLYIKGFWETVNIFGMGVVNIKIWGQSTDALPIGENVNHRLARLINIQGGTVEGFFWDTSGAQRTNNKALYIGHEGGLVGLSTFKNYGQWEYYYSFHITDKYRDIRPYSESPYKDAFNNNCVDMMYPNIDQENSYLRIYPRRTGFDDVMTPTSEVSGVEPVMSANWNDWSKCLLKQNMFYNAGNGDAVLSDSNYVEIYIKPKYDNYLLYAMRYQYFSLLFGASNYYKNYQIISYNTSAVSMKGSVEDTISGTDTLSDGSRVVDIKNNGNVGSSKWIVIRLWNAAKKTANMEMPKFAIWETGLQATDIFGNRTLATGAKLTLQSHASIEQVNAVRAGFAAVGKVPFMQEVSITSDNTYNYIKNRGDLFRFAGVGEIVLLYCHENGKTWIYNPTKVWGNNNQYTGKIMNLDGTSATLDDRGTYAAIPTSDIDSYALSEGTKYFATDLGKMLYRHNNSWVDALGNPVNTTYNTGDLSNYVQKSQTNGLLKNDGSVDITTYQEQVSGTTGNLAGFDANGKLADSGSKPSDFEPASA